MDLSKTTSVPGEIRQRQLFGYAAFPGTAAQPYFWNGVSIAAEKVEAN